MGPRRIDYAFPLRIDGNSKRTAQDAYAAHVAQMVEQVLLTDPGERVDLPQFGCGLRQLIFAPLSSSLGATLKLEVTQALGRWLAGVIEVTDVAVDTAIADAALEPGTVQVSVRYMLVDTQTSEQATVTLP